MAQVTTPTPDLAALEVLCQQHLQTKLPAIAPVQVNCYVKRETLLLVVQHRNPALAHPKRVFRVLEKIFTAEQLDQRYRGLMYLKIEGRPQPYAFNTYTPEPPARDVAAQVRAATPAGLAERETAATETDADMDTDTAAEVDTAPFTDADRDPAAPLDIASLSAELAAAEEEEDWTPDFDETVVEDETDGEFTELYAESELAGASEWGDRFWPALIAAGVAISIAVFSGSLYLVSRPCVFRRCEPLEVAQELASEALQTLQAPPSGQAVLQAQQQLQQAIALLESIPGWSHASGEAQSLQVAYTASADRVEELVDALQTAARAANLVQEPPLPVARWEEAQRLWRGAIATLDEIPADSELAAFARQKVQEYRENLSAINRRLRREREAVENFAAAREAAKIAEVRDGVAQSLENLRLALATWQTAADRLAAIPETTTPYVEAQQLLADYQPKLVQAQERVNRESFAQDAYDQGRRLGQLAESAQQLNQWEKAVTHWRNALNYIRQVSSDSFVYAKAQPLVERHSQALNSAQSRLEEKVQVRQARAALTRICAADDVTICVYTASETLLSVRLTPNYVRQVRQTAAEARNSNDVEVQADLLDHVFNLEKALEAVSEDTGIPLEIYTTDNVLVKRHNP